MAGRLEKDRTISRNGRFESPFTGPVGFFGVEFVSGGGRGRAAIVSSTQRCRNPGSGNSIASGQELPRVTVKESTNSRNGASAVPTSTQRLFGTTNC